MASGGQRRATAKGVSVMRMQPDLSVNDWARVFQLLTSQQLSCSATVSSGTAMGNMMQQFERELQYRCSGVSGSDMGSSTESNSAVDGGQQAKHQQRKDQCQDLAIHGVDVLLEHSPC